MKKWKKFYIKIKIKNFSKILSEEEWKNLFFRNEIDEIVIERIVFSLNRGISDNM